MPKTLDSLEAEIKSLKIQGARSIALESLKFLRTLSNKKGFGREFDRALKKLEAARPTAVIAHNILEELKKDKSKKTIDRLVKGLNEFPKRIGDKGYKIIKNNSTVLTFCHSSEVMGLLRTAKKNKKKFSVIVPETRPLYQGHRTMSDLKEMKVPATLIVDSAIASMMKDVDIIIIGSDAMRKEGNVNKIGSLGLSIIANKFKKKIYVVGDSYKIDNRKKFIIEERPAEEVANIKGKIKNPAFDVTTWKYIYRVINEKGIFTPTNALRSR
ncbi:MAG: hypothetical protein GOV02_02075 [Candidatus Aenigmarchaeota archaeon]|nr:hypothetical protein [Candidatus Aenigmarchaeota archaeon]